ncbi:hypothetical protein [uncultured Methylobacterium sp.]|uniref:hypothetical protein n=1 Tax=uncultured Methylobacterium sp. TaxID=157278 RepID=UPI0025915D05|nr:hypothetical protein [uncultured Methylobacterium sp.]
MPAHADDVLAPAAALNELAALALTEAAVFFEGVGQGAMADLLRGQARRYRVQAIQFSALSGANALIGRIDVGLEKRMPRKSNSM